MPLNIIKRNGNPVNMIAIGSSRPLLILLIFFLVGCQSPTDTTELKVDREIPPSEAFDASYGFWGPEGETIYFTHSRKLGSNPDPGKLDQLWKLNLATGQRRMIHTGRILNADISPDGQWFVFHSFSVPHYLYKMRSDGTDLQKLTGPNSPNPNWEYTMTAEWSPEGNRILFAVFAGNLRGISIMNSDGTNPKIIIPYGVAPSWSPDGDHIFYVNWDTIRVERNQRQVYRANRDGANPQQISDLKHTSKLSYPSLSPDGSSITFTLNEEVYLMGIDGSNVEQVTDGPGYVKRPEWSPDGKTILFSRIIQNVSKRLYYLDVATREVTPVFPASNNGNAN